MVHITEVNWKKVNALYQEKTDRLDNIVSNYTVLLNQYNTLEEERDLYITENDKLKSDNVKLKSELSSVLEKLNDTLNIIEKYAIDKTLSKRDRTVTDFDINVKNGIKSYIDNENSL